MAKDRVWALVRQPDGTIVRKLVDFQGTEKMEKRITDDFRKKLWLSKTHYKLIDDKRIDDSPN